MPRGGVRPGSGRRLGTKSSATLARERLEADTAKAIKAVVRKQERAARAALVATAKATALGVADAVLPADISPLDIITRVMRGDPTITREMYAAACTAAQYQHPKLSAVQMQTTTSFDGKTDAELRAELARLTREVAGDCEGVAPAEVPG